MDEKVSKALEGKKRGKKHVHTHAVEYRRADNGGFHAKVEKHHGKGPHSEGHSHTETHVLPDADAMQEHMQEHMGDQPPAGEMPEPQPAQQEPEAQPAAAGAM